jgi:hypothetical protein
MVDGVEPDRALERQYLAQLGAVDLGPPPEAPRG